MMKVHRALKVSGLIVAALYLTYVGAAFTILQLNFPERWTHGAERYRVSCKGGGYSLWPGLIHVKDTTIVVQDHNITMEITATRAMVDVGVLSVLSGTVHIEDTEVTGGRLKMRHRVGDAKTQAKRIAAFPTIVGFERSIEFPKGPRTWGKQRKVVIDHIRAEATELWFVEFRTKGDFVAEGSFTLDDRVMVFPCWMKANNVEVFVGEKKMIDLPQWDMSLQMGPFPRRKAKLDEVFAHLNAQSEFVAKLRDLGLIELYLSNSNLGLAGQVDLSSKFKIIDGKTDSGRIDLSSDRAQLKMRDVSVALAVGGQLDLAHGSAKMDLDARSVGGQKWGTLEHARLRLETKHDILTKWDLLGAQLSVEALQTKMPDLLRRLGDSSQLPLVIVHDGSADMSYDEKSGKLDARIDASGTWFLSPTQSLGLNSTVVAHCDRSENAATAPTKPEAPGFDCGALSLSAEPMVLATNGESSNLTMKVEATEFKANSDFQMIDSTWQLTGDNPKPIAMQALDGKVLSKLGLAVLPLGKWSALLHLNRAQTSFAGNLERATIGGLSVQGRFVFDQAMTSAWAIKTPVGRYGVRQTPDSTKIHLLISENWFGTCAAKLGPDC